MIHGDEDAFGGIRREAGKYIVGSLSGALGYGDGRDCSWKESVETV